MAEMTHINRKDATVSLKSKFYTNVRVQCTFIVEQKSFPYQTNGINKSK